MNEPPILQPPHMLASNTLPHWQPTDLQKFLGSFASSVYQPLIFSLPNFKPQVGYLNCSLANTQFPFQTSPLAASAPQKLSSKLQSLVAFTFVQLSAGEENDTTLQIVDTQINGLQPQSAKLTMCYQSFYMFYEDFLNIFFVSYSPHWIRRNKSMYLNHALSLGLVPTICFLLQGPWDVGQAASASM